MQGYHIRISLHCPSSSSSSTSTSYHHPSAISSTPSNIFIPASLFQQLPSHSPKSTARRNTLSAYHHSSVSVSQSERRDYRFGAIRVDWVDLPDMDKTTGALRKTSSGKEREREMHRRGEPATATFVPHAHAHIKSGSTNLPEGVIHIYRDFPSATAEEGQLSSNAPTGEPSATAIVSPGLPTTENISSNADASNDGIMLAVLAVPSWMTPSDFLAFVAPAAEGVAHLRMIRDSAPNRSIIVMTFRKASDAAEFAEVYNGKQFNSMEPEICHVVRVLSVVIDTDDSVAENVSRAGPAQGSAAMYELPTCPVCLERMDSAVTGLVTVPCSHTFHCACLSKWGDSRCPVCRYSQTLLSSHPTSPNTTRSNHPIPFSSSLSSDARSNCADCGSTSNLWICLICGNIGCGRYRSAHAYAHYARTTHLYALELETQRVWDYAGDGYVHRLIQNKADGKLVELPSAASAVGTRGEGGAGGGPTAADALSAEKIEAIGIEYSYLLTSQLDSQRTFYEEQTTELRAQVDNLRSLVEQLSTEVEKSKASARQDETKRKREEDARTAELEREKIKAEKRAEKAAELARTLAKELREERAVSEGLMKNLGKTKEQVDEAEQVKTELQKKVRDLEDQVRDVMFFLEARTKN
ncbi:RING finger protein ETP1 [Grifola frondosa]|uniref:RING finger protein ETP1 n=1 Tax=Grifola frondosa TaxID=5627 RepID=A0A1C7MBE8_GRIFR|nr:RING finger protein ETP1 [Grifola frondosa]